MVIPLSPNAQTRLQDLRGLFLHLPAPRRTTAITINPNERKTLLTIHHTLRAVLLAGMAPHAVEAQGIEFGPEMQLGESTVRAFAP